MSVPDYEQFPLDETRALVRGLFEPDPLIYRVDFLFSTVLGWVAFIVAQHRSALRSRRVDEGRVSHAGA